MLTMQLLNHGFLLDKVMSSLLKLRGHHHDLASSSGISLSEDNVCVSLVVFTIQFNSFLIHKQSPGLSGTTCKRVTCFLFRSIELNLGFQWRPRCSIFSFVCSLQIFVCSLVIFLLFFALSILRVMPSDFLFGIFKLFLRWLVFYFLSTVCK